MEKADLIAIHASAQHVIDHAKTIQKLAEQGLNYKEAPFNQRVWDSDLTRTTTRACSELDDIEVIIKHNRILKELEES